MNGFKRSNINYSIKTSFQLRIFYRIALIILLSILVTCAVFYFYANKEIGSSFKLFHINAKNFLDILSPVIIISGVLGAAIASIATLFFPHSIAGPLYRIEKELQGRIGNGDLTVRFNLRKGDELGELAENLNIALEKFSLMIKDIKSASDDLSKMTINKDFTKEELKEIQERLNGVVQKFKI